MFWSKHIDLDKKRNQDFIIAIWQAVFIKFLEQAVKRIFIEALGSLVYHIKIFICSNILLTTTILIQGQMAKDIPIPDKQWFV